MGQKLKQTFFWNFFGDHSCSVIVECALVWESYYYSIASDSMIDGFFRAFFLEAAGGLLSDVKDF